MLPYIFKSRYSFRKKVNYYIVKMYHSAICPPQGNLSKLHPPPPERGLNKTMKVKENPHLILNP